MQDPPLVSSPAPRFAVTALLLLGCSAAAVAPTVGDATRPAAASLPAPPDTEPDDDHDGVADVCDACPAVAGQVPDGCPQRVLIEECHFPTDGTVQFEADAATPTPPSAEIIEALARLIAAHPELRRVGVDGHASAGERDARRLSARRADAVLAALVARGVSASRLVARAYGVEAPVVPAAVPGAGARNRRVSLQILEADPPPQPPPPAPRRALPAGCPGSPAVPGAAAFSPLEGARSAVVIAAPFDAPVDRRHRHDRAVRRGRHEQREPDELPPLPPRQRDAPAGPTVRPDRHELSRREDREVRRAVGGHVERSLEGPPAPPGRP